MQEQLTEEDIYNWGERDIIKEENINLIYDMQDEIQRSCLIAALKVQARDKGVSRDLSKILSAYNKAEKQLAENYAREFAKKHSNIPLLFDGKGMPLKTIENFLIILREDDYFSCLKFNLFTGTPEKFEDNKIILWQDSDDAAARNYIERKYNIHNENKLNDALRIIFKERGYHPIKNIIESTEWDGKERIDTLLIKWMKCEDTAYSREVSRLIFAGGINRLYNPGCKFDDVPVLIGTKQGEGKSTFVRWLALNDKFFTEVCEFEGQKGIEAIEGVWICEVAELLALTRVKEVEAVKAYITKISDRYRKPFDKRVSEHPRQCIFIGTTNKEQFLTDKTGNRRFYPLKVYQNGYELFKHETEIKNDILQCWAEAKVKYDLGEMLPYADPNLREIIKLHQSEAVEDDYRKGLIEAYLEDKTEVCILEVWQKALKNDFSKPTKKDSNDISLILQTIPGWRKINKAKRFDLYGVQKYWKRNDDEFSEIEDYEHPFKGDSNNG